MLGILALFGPPGFGIQVGLLSLAYSVVLVAYALWAMRLTVVFRDDDSLGLLLCVFDVTLTLPLLIWGTGPTWLAAPVIGLWAAGFFASTQIRRRMRVVRSNSTPALVDPVTGFYARERFRGAVDAEAQAAQTRGVPFALVTVRVLRFGELLTCHGPEAADRAVSALSRRARRELGPDAEGFRLSDDVLALLVPTRGSVETAERASALSKAVNGRLIDGRRVDSFVGYAVYPRDGRTARELLASAENSTPVRAAAASRAAEGADKVAVSGLVAVASSQVALG